MKRLDGRFAALQIPGKRAYQEDDYGLLDGRDLGIDGSEHAMVLVADGMGGHVGGATASGLLCKTFVESYQRASGPIADRLRGCLDEANAALADAIAENPHLMGMGSTLVAAVISQRGLEWISVGDSPMWLFREGRLRRLNADHSMASVFEDLVAGGRMTAEEAATDPKRHALRSAVMGDEIHLIDVSSQPVAIKKGDRLLLASDGLMTLDDGEIARILQHTRNAPLEDSAQALIQAVEAAEHPHQDNATVLLYTPEADWGMASSGAPPAKRKRGLIGIALGVVSLAALLVGYAFWPFAPVETPPAKIIPPQPAESNERDAPAPSVETLPRDSQAVQPATQDSSANAVQPATRDSSASGIAD